MQPQRHRSCQSSSSWVYPSSFLSSNMSLCWSSPKNIHASTDGGKSEPSEENPFYNGLFPGNSLILMDRRADAESGESAIVNTVWYLGKDNTSGLVQESAGRHRFGPLPYLLQSLSTVLKRGRVPPTAGSAGVGVEGKGAGGGSPACAHQPHVQVMCQRKNSRPSS